MAMRRYSISTILAGLLRFKFDRHLTQELHIMRVGETEDSLDHLFTYAQKKTETLSLANLHGDHTHSRSHTPTEHRQLPSDAQKPNLSVTLSMGGSAEIP